MASSQFSNNKIKKQGGKTPSQCEMKIAQLLVDLEASNTGTLKAELRNLYITAAREITVGQSGKKATLIFVPYRFHKQFQKIHTQLQRELEKKLSGQTVIFIAQRTILSRNHKRKKGNQERPRSRTLTSVHNAILEDICYPTEIVGKREIMRTDGSRRLKVMLDPANASTAESNTDVYSAAYKTLTNRNVQFTFEL